MKLIICGTGSAGGVGKSTLVQLLAEMYRHAGQDMTVLLADDKGGDDNNSMADMLPEHNVVWLGTGPTADEITDDPDSLHRHWDKLSKVVGKTNLIVDFGANVLQRFVQYADASNSAARWKKAGVDVEVWLPFDNEPSNIDAALDAMKSAAGAFGASKLIAVRNEKSGPFRGWEKSVHAAAIDVLRKRGAVDVVMPKCNAPLDTMEAARKQRLSWFTVAAMAEDDLCKRLGFEDDDPVIGRMQNGVAKWIKSIYDNFGSLVPSAPGKE